MNVQEQLSHYGLSAEEAMDLAGAIAAERFQREDSEPIDLRERAAALFDSFLAGRAEECFAVAFLDTRHRLIKLEILFRGTVDGASVYPRVVAERALRYGAAAVLVAHNHPSGIVDPSLADQAITLRLIDALGLLDVRLLDHFVVGSEGAVSIVAQPESRPARAAKKPTRKPRGRKSAS